MRHIYAFTRQQPVRAQDGAGPNPLLKSLISFVLFGINPIFLLLFNAKVGGNDDDNGNGNGSN